MHNPDVALWRAVVVQAFVDATATPSKWASHPERMARAEARGWLIYDEDDFRTVCDFAELDWRAVREVAQKIRGDHWRNSEQFKSLAAA